MSIASTKRDTCIEVKRYPDGRKVTFDCDLLAGLVDRTTFIYG